MNPRRTTVTSADTGISPGRPSRCRPVERVRFITMLTALLDSVDTQPAGDPVPWYCVALANDRPRSAPDDATCQAGRAAVTVGACRPAEQAIAAQQNQGEGGSQ